MNQTVYKSPEGMMEIRKFTGIVMENWPVDHERIEVKANGYKTSLSVSGPSEGDPIILLHGTGTNSCSWMGDVSLLSEKFRVYAVDIPGEPGLSDERRVPFTDSGPARWLSELLKVLGIKSAHLIGMSLGGLYSLLFGTADPEHVRSMTLLAPSGIIEPKMSFLFKAIPLTMMGDWGLRKLAGIVSPGIELPEAMFSFSRLTAKHFKPIMEALPIMTDDELDRLTMPVLYFGGTKDQLLKTVESAERLRTSVSQAEINVIEGAGHTIVGKTEKIVEFIERNGK